MQLKRDTDYALRLLLCTARQTQENTSGISLQTLSKETHVPITIATRLCSKMEDADLLKIANSSEKSKRYLLGEDTINKTLYDVICAIEGHRDIFAVFDRTTELFSIGKARFQIAQGQFEDAMNEVTLQQLIEN